ncbi:HAD family hydrolase [Leptolyngbya sp. AN03gr2]|uniref:HAD family hydrolase n=1 Tax=unclassified Leptolyngbya TaxID=2650499 RepID=UPI003D31C43D
MLKAVLFDFNGVIINDEPLHDKLLEQLLIEENLRPKPGEFRELCLGRSDRVCLQEMLERRGRVVTPDYLDELVSRKAQAYLKEISAIDKLPIYSGIEDVMFKLPQCKFAIVSGALRSEIELVLERANLRSRFSVVVSGEDITVSKPEPDGYLLAVDRLNQEFPELQLTAAECLAIEDTFAGIQAAKAAKIPVVGVANSYPFHMLQRCANWTVDYLIDLEIDRIQNTFAAVPA